MATMGHVLKQLIQGTQRSFYEVKHSHDIKHSHKVPPSRVNTLSECFYKPCGKAFAPKRVDMVFCSPECKKTHYQEAYKKGVKLMQAKGMRFSKLETSLRLQRLYKYLSDREPHSTREIGEAVNLEAVGSSIGELRRNIRPKGMDISCRFSGRTQDGASIYLYQLVPVVIPEVFIGNPE